MEEDLRVLRAQVLKGVSRADLEATLRVLNAFNAADVPNPAPGAPQSASSAS